MLDMDIREALRTHVRHGEPPMGLTLVTVRVAARRARRTRAAALVSAAVVGGLVVAAVATQVGWPVAGRGASPRPGQFQVLPPCAAEPGPRPTGSAGEPPSPTEEQMAWARAQLTCFLATALPSLLADATYAQVPGAPEGPLVAYSLEQGPGETRVDAVALVHDAAGTGYLAVSVGVASPAFAAEGAEKCRIASTCTGSTGPQGETISLDKPEPDPVGGYQAINVWVYHEHTYVHVGVSNSDRRGVDGAPPAATRPEPVLSADQAVALALSPELYLFP